MMEVEKPWGVCWGCSAQLRQGGGISLSLSPTELVCDTESDHMTGVVAVFHTDCCCSSSSFAGFNPQLFTRPCNTSASSVMQTLVASAGKTSFITGGVDARRTVRKTSSSTCTDSLRLHSIIPSSPECQLLVSSSKLSEPKTTKDHRSLPHKSLVNSAPVLLTDHPAPTSEFSAEEEEEEEATSSSTSRGDLDSDPAAGLLSPVLIRQQQKKKKKKDAAVNNNKSTVKSPSIQDAAAAAGKGQSLLPVDQMGSPTKEGSNSRGKKKTQQQQKVPVDQMRSLTKEGIRRGKKKTRQQQSLPVDQMGSLTKDGSSSRGKKKAQQQQHNVELFSNSSDEYERMLMNLIDQLQGIRLHALALERWHAPQLKKVHRCVTRSIFHF